MIWIQFLFSAALIVIAGFRLTVYADILSDKFQISKIWIGVLLLGIVTSLPEAVTSLFAVVSLKATDLAVGNMLGSNNFNLMIIVVMDLLYRQGSVTDAIGFKKSYFFSGFLVIALLAIVIVEIFVSRMIYLPAWGHVSYGCILIAVIYILGIRFLSGFDTLSSGIIVAKTVKGKNTKKIFVNLFLSAAVVIGASFWLVNVTDAIAEMTGLGRIFVGTLFLAFVTSLPEIVVSVSALRLASLDLAFGNIFGSNMINMFILFWAGLFYQEGPIFASVSSAHVLTALLSINLTCIILLGIQLKRKKTFFNLGWDTLLMSVCFLAGMRSLYYLR